MFRSKLPLKLEFTSFTSFVLADALFSTGDTKAVQHNFCVAGMSCALRCFCLFFEVAKYWQFECSAKLCRHEACLQDRDAFPHPVSWIPEQRCLQEKKASANARLGGGKHNLFFKCLYVSKMPANHSID